MSIAELFFFQLVEGTKSQLEDVIVVAMEGGIIGLKTLELPSSGNNAQPVVLSFKP